MVETSTTEQIRTVLAVVRLGDVDHHGWWQSHGLDETGSFVLERSFKRTWAATALELSMASARVRHGEALARPDAVHLFSDAIPAYSLAHAWLLEQKLEDDMSGLTDLRHASTEELAASLPTASEGERRGAGLYLGSVRSGDLHDELVVKQLVDRLAGAYRGMGPTFVAPYVDLVD